MLSIAYDEVPEYLRGGDLFRSLDAEDLEPFEVPRNCFKSTAKVATRIDLVLLMMTSRFWGAEKLHCNAVFYLYQSARDDYVEMLKLEFPEYAAILTKILSTRKTKPLLSIPTAIELNCGVEVTMTLHLLGHILNADCCAAAATVNDISSLEYLHKRGCPWNDRTLAAAVQCSSVQCLQYALDHSCPDYLWIISDAIVAGDVDVIKCLRSNGFYIYPSITPQMAWKVRNVDVFILLRELGGILPPIVRDVCVARDRLDVLQYLHEAGYPLNLTTCAMAASAGSVACLQYAHENGCPWDTATTLYAARHQCVDCLRYAVENNCPIDISWFDPVSVHCARNLSAIGYRRKEYMLLAALNVLMVCIFFVSIVTFPFSILPWGLFLAY